jgi:hypothetical protein
MHEAFPAFGPKTKRERESRDRKREGGREGEREKERLRRDSDDAAREKRTL